jgi:hypothetical protein
MKEARVFRKSKQNHVLVSSALMLGAVQSAICMMQRIGKQHVHLIACK